MASRDASSLVPPVDKRHNTPQDPASQSKMAGSSKMALRTFSIENDVLEISPQDEIYRFNEAANKQINREAPWAQEYALLSIQRVRFGFDDL